MGKAAENIIKKRWISLYVENEIGVLAKISGLFSGKSYNLDSLTVGETEDETISRMTISVTSDESTFEQIKKQLNRSVEVIKVVDFTDIPIHMKEILFIKVNSLNAGEKEEVFHIAQIYGISIIDCDRSNLLLECVHTESKNNALIKLFKSSFPNRIEVIKGGSVAIEAISMADR
ncbi:MAG: acetolactate synthase, small subunit [Anaerocolumna sp.]|jgi:acetolactate synthase-1/3 small subunit|nr:acetolactate synthase, small subunit [Anaerocolumna sp.]